jgi:hypothetical protein
MTRKRSKPNRRRRTGRKLRENKIEECKKDNINNNGKLFKNEERKKGGEKNDEAQ